MTKTATSTIFLLVLVFLSASVSARSFQIREQNPLALIYGLPVQGDSFQNKEPGWSSDVLLTVSNTYNPQSSGTEHLIIDGETTVVDLVFSRQTNDRLRLGAHIPFLSHDAGGLDNFIINYHDSFGFPQGSRNDGPRHELLFQYSRDGVTYLDRNTPASGLGDIRLFADYNIQKINGFEMTAHASLKLPSGDSDKLTGSGATDFAGWLSGDYQFSPRLKSSWQAGMLWMGQGDVLTDQQSSLAWFFGGSLAWQFTSRITLQIQTDWHSSLYENSELTLLGPSLTLTTGGWIKISSHDEVAIAVMEDIDVGSAPDVQLHLGWRRLY